MRGVETRIQEIRHKIFTEVARMAYHTEWPDCGVQMPGVSGIPPGAGLCRKTEWCRPSRAASALQRLSTQIMAAGRTCKLL